MIRYKEITTYYEETEKEIEFDDELKNRYHYYKVFPEGSYRAGFDKSTGNLIVQFEDESKENLILPPLPNSPPKKYPSGKVYFSTSNIEVKKMARKENGYY